MVCDAASLVEGKAIEPLLLKLAIRLMLLAASSVLRVVIELKLVAPAVALAVSGTGAVGGVLKINVSPLSVFGVPLLIKSGADPAVPATGVVEVMLAFVEKPEGCWSTWLAIDLAR